MKRKIAGGGLMAVAAALWCAGSAWGAMSQVPLLTSSSSSPPNLMFTLDDSGSMDFECVPDALCSGSKWVGVVPWGVGGTFKNGVALYDTPAAPLLYGRKMRNSSFNAIYYDPSVRYRPWLRADGTRFPAHAATAAVVNAMASPVTMVNLTIDQRINTNWCASQNTCAASEQTFFPAVHYTLNPGAAGAAAADFTEVAIRPSGTFPKGANRTDCVANSTTCSYDEEIQNFSNWFTYARSRLQVAIAGTSEAFSTVSGSYRVGYGTINTTGQSVDGVGTNTVRLGVRPFSGDSRTQFYNQLQSSAVATGGTPLRRALDDVGQYFSRPDNLGPWGATPGTASTAAQSSCRRSFHVLMTDGVWNGAAAATAGATADVDSAAGTTITGPANTANPSGQSYNYAPVSPYAGGGGNTLADIAMYYWNRDLRPDLDNKVVASTANPAFWQHMVNYTIAFGVSGALQNPGSLPDLTTGVANWGTPVADNALANVDDLWHAALNSRGQSLSARNATEYANALKSIFQDIEAQDGSQAGIAMSGRAYSTTARKYVPSFIANEWSGDLQARLISAPTGEPIWSAALMVPAHANRNILTYQPTGTNKGVPFTLGGMDAAGMTSMLGTTDAENTINYLRGDRTREGAGYRRRTKLLGDIVNSAPVVVKDLLDSQYDFLPTTAAGQSTYFNFKRAKAYRQTQIFVGANDGMLHAFGDVDGAETFAFVPRAVLGTIKDLASPSYTHRYFVDGPTNEADIYDATAGKWRNVVLGTGGAGARNIFAVNVPVPALASAGATQTVLTAAQSAPGAGDVMWEIDSATTDYAELGFVLQPAEAGVMRDGRWVVIVGNGYESASHKAQLFVINALTGARIAVLDTGVGSPGNPNGLGGVKLLRDSSQRVVAAYAGDLQGNLWKFDFSSSTPGAWDVAFGGVAGSPRNSLFTATTMSGGAEPITATPALLAHPSGGTMVLTGSGKLFESADLAVTGTRALYGVWDNVAVGSVSSDDSQRLADNASLVAQSVTTTPIADTPGGTFYAVSTNAVDYGAGAGQRKRGWRLPLTIKDGQRLVYDPQLLGGRVFFDTLVPGQTIEPCDPSTAKGYTFVLDPFSGSPQQSESTFDSNGDGLFTSADSVSAGAVETEAGGQRGLVRVGQRDAISVGSNGGSTGATEPTDPSRNPRGVLTQLDRNSIGRSWRQIVNAPAPAP